VRRRVGEGEVGLDRVGASAGRLGRGDGCGRALLAVRAVLRRPTGIVVVSANSAAARRRALVVT